VITIFSLSFGYFYYLFNDTAVTSDFIYCPNDIIINELEWMRRETVVT
jgi:hypothetical protein